MESKQIRSSLMRFNGLLQPLHQETLKVFERHNQQPKGLNSVSNSGFMVIPTKELCLVYLQKPNLLASKGIIDSLSKPPHIQKFSRRYDQQNLKSKKLRPHHHHHTTVDSLKPNTRKKETSLRCFSPIGFSSGSHLGNRKKRQYLYTDKKSKEAKKLCVGTRFGGQKKDRVMRELGTKLMVSTFRDSVLSFEQTCNDRVAADVKLSQISSSGFHSKDENEDSIDCSNESPGCQTHSEEAHQPSPVSVLEPIFIEDLLDDSEELLPYLDSHGIEKQLETLKSESESYSDGSGMEVSSDEESVVDSETKESKHSEQIGFLDIQESMDSSYIDDILSEVVLGGKNRVSDKWDSLGLVITPKIFEKLEKKYHTETSWKRSERRILFDRVNSDLVEILESFRATPTWKKPVTMRLGTALSSCLLKQELWKVLARQEKRAKKESLTKMPVIDIDEWLEHEADDESVVCELESMIVDELLDEVVSFL